MNDNIIYIIGSPDVALPLEGRPGQVAGATATPVEDSHYYRRAILDGDIRLATDEEIAALDAKTQAEAEQAAASAAEQAPKTGKKENKQ